MADTRGHESGDDDQAKIIAARCWYNFNQLDDNYTRRMEWASRDESQANRVWRFKVSTYAFHNGLKILEHWDDFYMYTRFPDGHVQESEIDTWLSRIRDEPAFPFKALYAWAEIRRTTSAQNIIDSLDWARNIHPDARARYLKYMEERQKAHSFDSAMSATGQASVLREYAKVKQRKLDNDNEFRHELLLEDWVFFPEGKLPSG